MLYDLIIIGAGPAGVSAAVYAARQKLNFLVISKDMGGQIAKKAVDIGNYLGFDKISGPDLVKVFEEQLLSNQVEVIFDEVVKISKDQNNFKISTGLRENYETRAVIVSTGGDPRPLEVEGEKEFIGKGVSYCALCDGPVFSNKTVTVIGGGNAGFETALFLSNYVKKIYILEFDKEIKADRENQTLIQKTGKAEVVASAKVLKIQGDKFVKSIVYQDMVSNQERTIETDGIFIEIGSTPATAFVKEFVDFSEKDEIITDLETYATKTPGLFAAGDCNKGRYKQIVVAAGEGAKAALAVYDYLLKIKDR